MYSEITLGFPLPVVCLHNMLRVFLRLSAASLIIKGKLFVIGFFVPLSIFSGEVYAKDSVFSTV